MSQELLRKIPNVQELLNHSEIKNYPLDEVNKRFVLNQTLADLRQKILKQDIREINNEIIIKAILETLDQKNSYSLRKVINGTGVILHTNLGRSILPRESLLNFIEINSGYANVEYDLETQKRGNREKHLEKILQELTGCEASCVVNNNASAVFLVLNTLSKNKKIIISRGENVEIGGSFRIPEIIKASGAKIVDIGTTNKTYENDYKLAIEEEPSANMMLKIHKSNYDIIGFSHTTSIKELAPLKTDKIYLVEDQGSGTIFDLTRYNQKLTKENTVKDSLQDGADLVLFSGDKLLGSAQAGIIVGKKELIAKIKKNQLFRMLRTSKMVTSILEATLSLYKDEELAIKNIPTLKMICESVKEVEKRVDLFLKLTHESLFSFEKINSQATIGGGSLPGDEIESWAVKVNYKDFSLNKINDLFHKLPTPIICKLQNKSLIIDFKTIQEHEIERLVEVINNVNW
ncbi:L-seryl-tRNA(Ser) seleniumtransferase [Spiroplasma chinense]|uniref:L-seryl-tRNA(Sec) selenium transferase n=1 Tax=Spiroplasma chinense TaxID=216932 RepID=A0A5B9Y579_9MOLU|nr:L-seryl-tRNA(Sec) selenium transferase [Spiroplasma chinense]QEH61407.1 L-seryl-tRNA(Ser) seleniumtransferase [Spiroplasma chinense]